MGLPARWYITGKTGEVVKKRTVDRNAISQRWNRISQQSNSPIIAVLRQQGGLYKFLNIEAWEVFLDDFMTPDSSIISLHCFVKGNQTSFFRNRFELKDMLSRFVTSTHSFTYVLDYSQEVNVIRDSDCQLVEIKAASLRNIMDLATHTVIRYLELILSIKVLSLNIDYIIDSKSQLWMLWSGPASFVRNSNLTEVRIPGLPSGDVSGRMSWAGAQYASSGDLKRPGSSVNLTKKSSVSSISSRLSLSRQKDSPQNSSVISMKADLPAARNQITTAAAIIDGSLESNKTLMRKAIRDDKTPNSLSLHKISVISEEGALKTAQHVKCQGDYCHIRLEPIGALEMDPERSGQPLERLFSEGELEQLRSQAEYQQLMLPRARTDASMSSISAKSIYLARQERRYEDNTSKVTDDWKNYPTSPRSRQNTVPNQTPTSNALKMHTRRMSPPTRRERDKDGASSVGDESVHSYHSRDGDFTVHTRHSEAMSSQESLDQDRSLARESAQREQFTKQMARYYEQVPVCGLCHQIYTTLDWARDILAQKKDRMNKDGSSRASSVGKRILNRRTVGSTSTPTLQKAALTNPVVDVTAANDSDAVSALSSIGHNGSADGDSDSYSKSERSPGGLMGADGSLNNRLQPQKKLASLIKDTDSRLLSATRARRSKDPSSTSNSNDDIHNGNKRTWKDYVADKEKEVQVDGGANRFNELDGYLRSGTVSLIENKARRRAERTRSRVEKLKESILKESTDATKKASAENLYRAKVLIACCEAEHVSAAKSALEEAFFDVTVVLDCREAINVFLTDDGQYDCVLVDRNIPLGSAFELTEAVRGFEKKVRNKAAAQAAAQGRGVQPATKRVRVICFTSMTSPEDLKMYVQADMDGCVSYPVKGTSLLNTIRAAVPHHLAVLQPADSPEKTILGASSIQSKLYHEGPLGALAGSLDSASLASQQMSLSASMEDDMSASGVVQIDPDTRITYVLLDALSGRKNARREQALFNLVVCHDMFDTSERLKIFFKPIVQKYVGLQVLLWNYAGQAFTEWRSEQLLTSEFHTLCLNELLGQLGSSGSQEFDSSKPFYIMGYGFGAQIAAFYLTHYRVPNVRGLIVVNGWSFVDSNLAAALHDCVNVFECTPAARPDLPVYFFSRFLFSKDYLSKVSVPLALNLYTAVHNPITIRGRVSLCRGALASLDLRPLLGEIDVPLICIQGTQDAFSRALHTEPFVHNRGGEVRSVYRALQDPDKTCVIWVKSGHEIFQECRKQTLTLIEQLLTGFHETNDLSFPGADVIDPHGLQQGHVVASLPQEESFNAYMTKSKAIEDKFIDNVLGSLSKKQASNQQPPEHRSQVEEAATNGSFSVMPAQGRPHDSVNGRLTNALPSDTNNGTKFPGDQETSGTNFVFTGDGDESSAWLRYSKTLAGSSAEMESMATDTRQNKQSKRNKDAQSSQRPRLILDPTTVAFERQDNTIYSATKQGVNPANYPEVKEYMGWRLKRNKKRLLRLQAAAKVIQTAYRRHLAIRKVERLRRIRAAITIQRVYRGWLGRCRFLEQARRIWATQLIQRVWRGYAGRLYFYRTRMVIAAAVTIQRLWRGVRTRTLVNKLRDRRRYAATALQALVRRNMARKRVWRMRQERFAAIEIQRVFRGNLGKRKAATERDKYIFSRSQTQGIEFGRQMLLEHKLHATRLQSDVTLLNQEKVGAEEQVEALLEEISSFEDGVRILEKEMHQLSKVESEAAAYLDDQAKGELREQKMRLDKEFGEMLLKISNRKELLNGLEQKLNAIDKSRQSKEEELRTLERKLVVLLEEQQNELNAIKRKQDVRGALLAASHEQLMKAGALVQGGEGGPSTALVPMGASGPGVGGAGALVGGAGRSGPSIQEKRQAAQLMQSTETLMKFGFMSMSMTYFSSLNMIKALRTVSAQDTVMAALADVHAQRAVNFGMEGSAGGAAGGASAADGRSVGSDILGSALGVGSQGKSPFLPGLRPGQLPGQEPLRVSAWSVEDVARWLQTLALSQYCEAFQDAAVDGEFLYDLNDDDLKNTLGVEHRLHRKKILNCIYRLKIAEAQRDSRVESLLTGKELPGEPVSRK